MSSWADLEAAEPEFTAALRDRFDAHLHKLLATVRRDGSPRISGIETVVQDGELWLAGMPDSRKFHDLRRDPRLALHSGSDDADPQDPAAWPGDAKLAGTATQVSDPAELAAWAALRPTPVPGGNFELFRVDVLEATRVHMGDPADHLVIDHWSASGGLRRTTRR